MTAGEQIALAHDSKLSILEASFPGLHLPFALIIIHGIGRSAKTFFTGLPLPYTIVNANGR